MKKLVALISAVGLAVYWFGFRPACGKSGAVACPEPALEEGVGVALIARDVCPGSGYLCNQKQPWQVIRWPLDKGKLRVRITLPDFLKGRDAEQIRDAVIEGILQWNNQPFPIVIEKGMAFRWDINVNWTEALSMEAIGIANPAWQFSGKRVDYSFEGMGVAVPPSESMTRAVRLAWVRSIAAHEMGHALGILWHSDRQSDVMYPTINNAPSGPSERDFRTVEALYALPNGATVQ